MNKIVSKVSAQKKGLESYDSYKCVQISVVSGLVPPGAIDNFPQPQTKKDVQVFSGMKSYCRKLIVNFAAIAASETDPGRENQTECSGLRNVNKL